MKLYNIAEIKQEIKDRGYKVDSFEIYTGPEKPTEHGKYYGKTPILEQAINVVEQSFKNGKTMYIAVRLTDGNQLFIL